MHAVVGEWSAWKACLKSCGSGGTTRKRDCKEAQHGGNPCPDELQQAKRCEIAKCPGRYMMSMKHRPVFYLNNEPIHDPL